MIILQIIICIIVFLDVTCGMDNVCNSNNCDYIDCNNKNFTMFGDWKCTHIVFLEFIGNNIGASELRKLARYKITYLNLSFNNISNIPNFVFNGTQIDQLFLENNNLSKINADTFHGMAPLKDISLKHNLIKLIDPQSIPKAQIVELSYNKLETINANMFVNISYMNILYLDYNYIKSIDENSFKGFIGFRINLNFNKLRYLCAKSIPAVKIVTLRGNQILVIDRNAFVNITNLYSVDVSLNCIQKRNLLLTEKYIEKDSIQFDNCSSVDIEGNQETNKQITESQCYALDQRTESFTMQPMETDDIHMKFIIYVEIVGILLLIIAIQTVLIIGYRWRVNSISNTVSNDNNGGYIEPTNEYEEINDVVIERESSGYIVPLPAL
ncbi:PREDICTED: leucine-rich repeat-containing protein let-4-like isoform X2 [Nicrophorus vespilloides]|uniref:Leucine-rich repeat-containing protein let-4-like isoform X2 n=1 Tax=Nicrophorus vespilloides TaxID=110193 RepID=A0ABM1MKI6_NICVS|nr:PREDICTED: leucine-rich repeat-containing protein let-4-like isoform X2 [Nicrophorus vespilloides]